MASEVGFVTVIEVRNRIGFADVTSLEAVYVNSSGPTMFDRPPAQAAIPADRHTIASVFLFTSKSSSISQAVWRRSPDLHRIHTGFRLCRTCPSFLQDRRPQ